MTTTEEQSEQTERNLAAVGSLAATHDKRNPDIESLREFIARQDDRHQRLLQCFETQRDLLACVQESYRSLGHMVAEMIVRLEDDGQMELADELRRRTAGNLDQLLDRAIPPPQSEQH